MAYTTPALAAMNEGRYPIAEALTYAGNVLQVEGVSVEAASTDEEECRHLFAVALDFQQDVHTLRTLAGLAFSDDHLGPGLLHSATSSVEAVAIARDFNTKHQQMHPLLSYVCKYVRQLRELDDKRPNLSGIL